MSFAAALARLEAAVFDRLGQDADWESVGVVRVRYRTADEELRFERGSVVETGHRIKVRKSDVAAPASGQTVQLLDDFGDPVAAGLFEISGTPRIDRRGTWTCDVVPLAP